LLKALPAAQVSKVFVSSANVAGQYVANSVTSVENFAGKWWQFAYEATKYGDGGLG
jgi:hypothetical protein